MLATAIREVQKGNTFFSPSISKRARSIAIRKSPDRAGAFKKKSNRLSSREVEVLQLIAEGKPNKQVAAELGVELQNGGQTSGASHGEARHPRHRRPHPLRHRAGIIESSVQLTIV